MANGKKEEVVKKPDVVSTPPAVMEAVKPVATTLQIGEAQTLSEGEIKASVFLARTYPRSEMQAYQNVMETCKRPSFAERSTYLFPRGGRNITGPSIILAREIARNWKNVLYGYIIIFDNEEKRTIRCWAFDTESNIRISVDDTFEKLIFRKVGGWIKPDERDLRELTGRKSAIGIRNCLLQLFPQDLIEDAMTTSRETMKSQVHTDPKETIKKLMGAFLAMGVDSVRIEKYLEHKIDIITPDEIADLRGIYGAINDGTAKASEYFNDKKVEEEKSVE